MAVVTSRKSQVDLSVDNKTTTTTHNDDSNGFLSSLDITLKRDHEFQLI
jgi:hypothetical protein